MDDDYMDVSQGMRSCYSELPEWNPKQPILSALRRDLTLGNNALCLFPPSEERKKLIQKQGKVWKQLKVELAICSLGIVDVANTTSLAMGVKNWIKRRILTPVCMIGNYRLPDTPLLTNMYSPM